MNHEKVSEYLVINGYRFVEINENDLPDLRVMVYEKATELALHGTVLLSPEGINVALCGKTADVELLVKYFDTFACTKNMTFKFMPHDMPIFRRLIVKVKSQIIVFEDKKIDANDVENKRMQPAELKSILDNNPDDIVLLDTRNQFEVEFGTFKQADTLPVRRFRSFCKVIDEADIDKNKTVVTFCTGGVRCEKVVPYMRKQGYKNVYQLEGGIFNYFKEVGGAHWNGECFVFDYRTALGADLRATGTQQCRACYGPVSVVEQQEASYVPGESCPRCIEVSSECA
jgi:UPF0176 protein